MVRYYRDPDGTQVLSSNDKTLASQTGTIGKLPQLESPDMDGLKQRVKELEDLLNKHNVCIYNNVILSLLDYTEYHIPYRFLGTSVKMLNQ